MASTLRFRVLLPPMYLLVLSFQAPATQLCRWIDEEGRTQVSDKVPPKYKQVAKCADAAQYNPTDAQRREAEARAQADRQAEAKAQAAREATAKGQKAAAKASGDRSLQGNAPLKPESVSSTKDCATLHRLYRESQECFAAFRLSNAAVRPEAYKSCTEVLDPSPQCGPPED